MSGDVVVRARAALESVLDGPWMVSGGVVWREDVIAVPDPNDPTGQTPMPEQVQERVADSSPGIARFVAEARSLVPELVEEVERLRTRERWVKTHVQICAVSMRARGNADGERDMLDILATLERGES